MTNDEWVEGHLQWHTVVRIYSLCSAISCMPNCAVFSFYAKNILSWMNTANGTVLLLCRQLANLDKGRDARQIILRQSDDIAFAQALHQQVEEWLQASL